MKWIARGLAALLVALGASLPALATTASMDVTDLWFVPTESGWGVNFIQQGEIVFATLFVYGPDNQARWYVASALTLQAGSSPSTPVFAGDLFQTTGPYFATVPFNPSTVTAAGVGTMSVSFDSATTGTLIYNVGSASAIVKRIQRQTFRNNLPVGGYFGGMSTKLSNCGTASNNGQFVDLNGQMTVTTAGNTATFVLNYFNGNGVASTCTFTGPVVQAGRYGSITNGQWSCNASGTVNVNGTFSLSRIDSQVTGLTATIVAVDAACTYTGFFGGITVAN
jgi:hypothetical protein